MHLEQALRCAPLDSGRRQCAQAASALLFFGLAPSSRNSRPSAEDEGDDIGDEENDSLDPNAEDRGVAGAACSDAEVLVKGSYTNFTSQRNDSA